MELEAFDAQFAEAVERSFRDDAIRTAVLIDDQFPNYLQMRDAPEADFRDAERAKRLYSFLHGRGLICDIQNWRAPADANMDLVDKVRKSDLVVLDYQLGAGGPATALSILRHLAVSSHFNLVVLYTGDPLRNVALAAAVAMRGLEPAAANKIPSEEALAQAAEILDREDFREIDSPSLRDYLTTGNTPWLTDLRLALQEASVPLKNLKPLTDYVARAWIAQLFDNFEPATDPVLPLRCKLDDPDTIWIHCGSCFVAVVNKLEPGAAEDEGSFVWRRLGEALRNWRPNLYRLILSDIQNALEQEAVVDHEAWLDDNLCLGLGLYLLESEAAAAGPRSRADVEGSTQNLIDRFIDLIRRRLATYEQVSTAAADLLEARLSVAPGAAGPDETVRHVRARELAHVDAGAGADWRSAILPAVNAFMVSDSFRGSHVTTGTVLRTDSHSYWLCVSPACDLEPRGEGPVILQLIKLTKTTTLPSKFSTGEHVAIAGDDGPIILQALSASSRQPTLKVVFLPGGTHVVRDPTAPGTAPTISGWFATGASPDWVEAGVDEGQAGAPAAAGAAEGDGGDVVAANDGSSADTPAIATSKPTVFTVVSQLRNAFATRFLLSAGQHLSRIGVDFIDS